MPRPRYRLRSKTLRDAANWHGDTSGYAIANRTGVDESTISRLMAGKKAPSLATLMALRAAYNLSLDDLVTEDEEAAA